jgi:23S rRNA pseudouridine1911/1915/1917 synthase
MSSLVLQRSTEWIWLNKPSGLPVFPLHQDSDSDCVLRRLLAEAPQQAQGFAPGFEGGIAHRLDTPTSGLLLVARSPQALSKARAAFQGKQLIKNYRFLSSAPMEPKKCTLEQAIAHHPKNRRKMVVQRNPGSKCRGKWYSAHTRLRHIKGALHEAVITTGVMHQIRVHAAFAGAPLLGDTLYGGTPSPDGPDFYLHHAHLKGLGACPFLPPPGDWSEP